MLTVEGLSVDIQASRILRDVSLEVGERELVGLVGRNGAGKTTTLRTIMGYRRPRRGLLTRGERGLRRSHGRREHRDGDVESRDGALGLRPRGPGLSRVSPARSVRRSGWRPALRGRAQDAVPGPGARPRPRPA